jgi:NADH-quinone oxidoreductase subunit L
VTHLAWLLPVLPALAAALGLLGSRVVPGGPGVPAVIGSAATLVIACLVAGGFASSSGAMPLRYADYLPPSASSHDTSTSWTPIGGVTLNVGTHVDGLVVVTALMVAVVALLVQVYSTAYMAGDVRYGTYAAEVSLFTAAMMLVVVASSFFELLVGWELMGLCSYLLIGHYHHDKVARDAAVKSFIVTRVGDVGFLFGIFVLGTGFHSFDIATVNGGANVVANPSDLGVGGVVVPSHTALVVGTLLLLAGVVGKSAQFPLHVWLPDAMAGPTPISALIHAATMVAAGIFLVARLYPVFLAAPVSLAVLGVIACITMLGAALAALAQDDLKRVLAWSTCSQLAYMAGALAVRGWTAGVYALLTHAAFKALLFLAAGSVLHAVKTNSMSQMGGLRRRMPVTFWTMVVGALALAGIPPFAGGFSKDGVLDAATTYGGPLGDAVYVVGLLTAFVTAAYVTRMILRTFFGGPRGEVTPHESSRLMTVPLVVLAGFVLALGLPALPHRYGISRWLSAPVGTTALHLTFSRSLLATVVALAGVGLMTALWRRDPAADPVAALGRGLVALLADGFFLDTIYDRTIVRPAKVLAHAVVAVDTHGVDATAVGAGRGARLVGGGLRWLQNGNAQRYATGLVLGVVIAVLAVAR